METTIHVYTDVPEGLLALLTAHLPYSLPTLRRLQFMQFDGGRTATTCVLFASDIGEIRPENASPVPKTFIVAYLDFSRGPETEMWLYSSLEDNPQLPDDDRRVAEAQIVALVEELKKVGNQSPSSRAFPGAVLVGAIHSEVRRVLQLKGANVIERAPWWYEKWLFRTEELPADDYILPEGLRWSSACLDDLELVISRTSVPREAKTLKLLPSLMAKLEDGTPIAWAFLGADGSLSSLHCEDQYRRRGIAKALAVRLFRNDTGRFGPDGWCSADVAPDNQSSLAVCKALNGKKAWDVSWILLGLDDSLASKLPPFRPGPPPVFSGCQDP